MRDSLPIAAPNPEPTTKIMTISDVADFLGISKTTVRRFVREERTLGGQVRVAITHRPEVANLEDNNDKS